MLSRLVIVIFLLQVGQPWLYADVEKSAHAKPEPPAAANAPFGGAAAREHQKNWAKHLGVNSEVSTGVGVKLVLIPAGTFLMGSSESEIAEALEISKSLKVDDNTRERIKSAEQPQRRVAISRPFYLGQTEITIAQFRKFVEATKYVTEAEKYGSANTSGTTKATSPQREAFTWQWPGYNQEEHDAVSQVSWNDAVVFCNWLSQIDRLTPSYTIDAAGSAKLAPAANGYRLPTEAEWEFACRAGTTGQYSFGDDAGKLGDYGWFLLKSGSKPDRAVGSKKANPFGLFDMHGNVFEWCEDGFDATWYVRAPHTDPLAPPSATRVMRGGDWFGNAVRCRSAFRGRGHQTTRSDDVGFRLARHLLK